MVRITVLYPNEAGKTFDHKGQAGGAPGTPAPYVALGHVYFDRAEDFAKGMGQHGKEIMADIPNYTNIQPQIQISEIIG